MAGDAWSAWPFEEVIDFQEGPGILAKDFHDEGIPLVRLSGLDRGGSVLKGCNYLDPETVRKRWSHFALQQGDILLSTSASLGRIAVVGEDAVGAIAYTGIIRMRPQDKRLCAQFIRYLLEGPEFQQQAEVVGVGSVIRHFGPMHLRQMSVRLPPPAEQRTIARILGTLDDKIELNRRMNETLEAMARALFTSWFVDFDPVRARAEGRDSGLPQSVVGLFPDSFVNSNLGQIPKAWRVVAIRELARNIQYGFTQSASSERVGPHFLRITDIQGGKVDWGTVPFCTVSPEEHERYRLGLGDILVARTGASTGENIYLSWAPNAVFASYLVRFQFSDLPTARLVGAFMRTQAYFEYVAGCIGGSAQPNASAQVLAGAQIVAPTPDIARMFNDFATSLDRRIATNNRGSRTLIALRDVLLPKLISGELRVKDAETAVAAAV